MGALGILRRIRRTILQDLAILLVLVLIGEAGVRILFPQTSQFIFSPALTGRHPIRYNSHGLRDTEFPTARPPGERRILSIGDSTTFGAGLAAEETYPKQLERLLNERSGERWFVINAGGQGSSVSALLNFLRKTGMAFDPSIVTLGFSATMPSVAGHLTDSGGTDGLSGEPEKASSLPVTVARAIRSKALDIHVRLHSSYLYVFLDTHIRRRLYRLGAIRDRMDTREGAVFAYAFDVPGVELDEVERAYRIFYDELKAMKRFLDERRIPLIVLGIPSQFRISEHWRDNERGYDLSKIRIEPLDRIATTCAGLGVPFVDLRPRLREERQAMLDGKRQWDDLFIRNDYAHLNTTGTRLAAEELLRALTYR